MSRKRGSSDRGNRLAGGLFRMRRQRIHEGAVALETVIEVRSGRGAGRPDPANDLSLIDVRARSGCPWRRRTGAR